MKYTGTGRDRNIKAVIHNKELVEALYAIGIKTVDDLVKCKFRVLLSSTTVLQHWESLINVLSVLIS